MSFLELVQNSSCPISASSDATGPGVSWSVYLQFAAALVATVVHVASDEFGIPTRLSRHDEIADVMQGGFAALGIATALVISAIVQAKKYGLAVYDALALLNLCWIMISSAIAPYSIAIMNSGTQNDRRQLSDKLESMLWAYTAALSFVGAFGVWVFFTLPHFDTTPDNCTLQTIAWVFGHHVHVDDIIYRRFWKGIYFIMAIPFVNLIVLTIVLYPFTLITLIPFHRLARHFGITRDPRRNLHQSDSIGAGISLGAITVSVVFIILNERTIRSNNVQSADRQWTLGQIFALLGALFPVFAVLSKLVKVARHYRKGHLKTVDDNASGIEMPEKQTSSSPSSPPLAEP